MAARQIGAAHRRAVSGRHRPACQEKADQDDWQRAQLGLAGGFERLCGTGGGPQARTNSGSGWTLARALVGLCVGIAGDRVHKSCRDGQPVGKAWKVTY